MPIKKEKCNLKLINGKRSSFFFWSTVNSSNILFCVYPETVEKQIILLFLSHRCFHDKCMSYDCFYDVGMYISAGWERSNCLEVLSSDHVCEVAHR